MDQPTIGELRYQAWLRRDPLAPPIPPRAQPSWANSPRNWLNNPLNNIPHFVYDDQQNPIGYFTHDYLFDADGDYRGTTR